MQSRELIPPPPRETFDPLRLTNIPVRTLGYATICTNSSASVASTFAAFALKLRTNWPSSSPCATLDAESAGGRGWYNHDHDER